MKQFSGFLVIMVIMASIECFGAVISTNYVNCEEWPVKISIQYYRRPGEFTSNVVISLNQGDMYEPIPNDNGMVHRKYGLMPDIARPHLPSSNQKNKNLNQYFLNVISQYYVNANCKVTPSSVIKSWIMKYESDKGEFLQVLTNSSLRSEYSLDWKLARMSYTTNVTARMLDELSNPAADADKDGYDNKEESLCETNPLSPDLFFVRPSLIMLKPDGCEVITNVFTVYSNVETGALFRLSIPPQGREFRWKPRIVDLSNLRESDDAGVLYLSMKPFEEREIAFLANKNELPTSIAGMNDISISMGSKYLPERPQRLNVRVFLDKNHCGTVSPPELVSPQNGCTATNISQLVFEWFLDKQKVKPKEGAMDIEVEIYKLFQGGVNLERAPLYSEEIGPSRLYVKMDCDYLFYPPGLYVWRAKRNTACGVTAYSEWRWFSIGRNSSEAAFGKTVLPLRTTNKVRRHNPVLDTCFSDYFDYWSYVNCDGRKVSAHFVNPLPPGLNIECSSENGSDYRVTGVATQTGVYTNYLICTGGSISLTNMHIFIVTTSPIPGFQR